MITGSSLHFLNKTWSINSTGNVENCRAKKINTALSSVNLLTGEWGLTSLCVPPSRLDISSVHQNFDHEFPLREKNGMSWGDFLFYSLGETGRYTWCVREKRGVEVVTLAELDSPKCSVEIVMACSFGFQFMCFYEYKQFTSRKQRGIKIQGVCEGRNVKRKQNANKLRIYYQFYRAAEIHVKIPHWRQRN